jgi:hypothetical protein
VARFDRRWTVWPLKAPGKAIPDETLDSTVTASVVNMTAVEGANASAATSIQSLYQPNRQLPESARSADWWGMGQIVTRRCVK